MDPHYHSVADAADTKMYDAKAGEGAHLRQVNT